MLDIKKVQSTNRVTIMGTLNELNIENMYRVLLPLK